MSSRFYKLGCAAVLVALSAPSFEALAQSYDDQDPVIRIQRLEEQLRRLTGQNEELQFRNHQLEERLQQLQGGAAAAPAQPGGGAAPPMQSASQGTTYGKPEEAGAPQAHAGYGQPQAQAGYGQPQAQAGYGQPQAQAGYGQPQAQAGYGQPQAQAGYGRPQGEAGYGGYAQGQGAAEEPSPAAASTARRGDAFDPTQHPNAPGAPRALGGGQLPIPMAPPGGREAGEPIDLVNAAPATPYQQGGPAAPSVNPGGTGGPMVAPPSASPRDEYDLGIGYMERRDYGRAEQTMRDFAEKFPSDALVGDSQYWLGESYFQRQQYRSAAEAFLAVTTKYEKSTKAPDALLRLGQSLAALKEKEAACAAYGEVKRKYPRASAGVKATVDREQKKQSC